MLQAEVAPASNSLWHSVRLPAIALFSCCRVMETKADSNGVGSGQLKSMPGSLAHFSLAILLLYGMNTGLAKFTHAAGIQFPSALIGK